ncbi:FmdE family protein [Cloacibacillus sp. An23]|uniref:FmdE family protein n=1 Tax=Cloacibacillus sp. An23 TaxID=1965591 RepID=UPI000B39035D|nr:FmdE family protein [Cloacibacillus sp. An23]OUO92638.1 formylmethanofuran dehydrogenase [Cloacibacillus sp. An23]
MADKESLYEKCVEFHGHSCGGLLIGFRAALYAMEYFGLERRAGDEEIVCVAENDACGVDAIQALLGCTAGKGNLIFRLRGKQAFTFYERKSGKAFRIVLKETEFADKEAKKAFMLNARSDEIFDLGEAPFPLPAKAKIYASHPCAACGEKTAEPWLRVKDSTLLCIDCWERQS